MCRHCFSEVVLHHRISMSRSVAVVSSETNRRWRYARPNGPRAVKYTFRGSLWRDWIAVVRLSVQVGLRLYGGPFARNLAAQPETSFASSAKHAHGTAVREETRPHGSTHRRLHAVARVDVALELECSLLQRRRPGVRSSGRLARNLVWIVGQLREVGGTLWLKG